MILLACTVGVYKTTCCSIIRNALTEFKIGKRAKPPVPAILMLGNNEMKAKAPVKNVGRVISENLSWSDRLNYRIGKGMKAFSLLRRGTPSLFTLESKIHFNRAVISPILFFSSEWWELRRFECHIFEKLHKKVVKWICGSSNYKEALKHANILPPRCFKFLNDLLMFSSLATRKCNVHFSEEFQFVGNGRRQRVLLPDIRHEVQRLNFWYGRQFRVNVIDQRVDFLTRNT